MNTADRCIAAARVAAMTDVHNRHAAKMRQQGIAQTPNAAINGLQRMARILARQAAHKHDTGVYAIADTERLYARRLLLQATVVMFDGTAEGNLLRAVDAWLTLGSRQHSYTEADSAAMLDIMCDLTEAAEDIADEILTLSNEIDGE